MQVRGTLPDWLKRLLIFKADPLEPPNGDELDDDDDDWDDPLTSGRDTESEGQ